jgi:hypothetical protein
MNYAKRFVVEPGAKVKLHKIDPGYIDPDVTEKEALAETNTWGPVEVDPNASPVGGWHNPTVESLAA